MSLCIFRHLFQLDRAMVARLPVWERDLLLEYGRAFLQIGDESSVDTAGLSRSEFDAITTPGVTD